MLPYDVTRSQWVKKSFLTESNETLRDQVHPCLAQQSPVGIHMQTNGLDMDYGKAIAHIYPVLYSNNKDVTITIVAPFTNMV